MMKIGGNGHVKICVIAPIDYTNIIMLIGLLASSRPIATASVALHVCVSQVRVLARLDF